MNKNRFWGSLPARPHLSPFVSSRWRPGAAGILEMLRGTTASCRLRSWHHGEFCSVPRAFFLLASFLCELTPKEMALGAPKLQTPLSSASPREAFRVYPGFLSTMEEYLFGELVFPVTPVGLQHAAEPFRYCLNPGLPLGAAAEPPCGADRRARAAAFCKHAEMLSKLLACLSA